MSSEPLRFDNRVAIVTGSGRGLGREYALLLARLGAAVVVNSITAATAETTAKEITASGGKAIPFVGNVKDREVANAIVQAAIDSFGRIDIVISNAGGSVPSEFESTSDSQLWDTMGVHLGGSWNVTQAAWPYLKCQKFGRVIFVTSSMMFGSVQQTTYGAAKLALVGLAKSLSLEGKEHNIFVNTLAPIAFTPGSASFVQDEQTKDFMKQYVPAQHVAPTVAWLAHEDSRVNGESLGAVGKLVTRIFLAETNGFFGPADQDWSIETIRDNWEKVVDAGDYHVPNDMAEFGPRLFQRLATGQ